ncbi:MAG: hybrid sensor histidine kinase/response regulator [Anaerolineae bacterium]|nr:hybrid sensor histidine kinase/response regulator [Anaerolineae bacterium]
MAAGARTVLIIEGNSAQLQQLERMLHGAKFQTLSARRALEGLDIARQMRLDLILTAIDLPDLSGRELATTLRADERFKHVPIVALLDTVSDEGRSLNLAAGLDGFIQRPINPASLPIFLEFYLSGGRDTPDDHRLVDAARQEYLQNVVSRLEERIRELEQKNEELRHLDGMKDSFIQLTAHELRTPLTLVTGYLRLLEDDPRIRQLAGRDEDFHTVFGGMVHSMNRMQSIVEEILITSRIMTSKITLNVSVIHPAEVLQRALAEYSAALKDRQITVHVNQVDIPATMYADGDLLYLTFANLLSNAIKYTPDRRDIYITAGQEGQSLRLSVRDTGIGIDPAQQERIFQRMQLTRDIGLHGTSKVAFGGGGLGLGLAICHGIIEAHGGRIMVHSPGHDPHTLPGSEFVVLLPLVAVSTRSTATLKRLAARTSG